MDLAVPPPFRATGYIVRFAEDLWECQAAAALRRDVFCTEQGIFLEHDRDEIDEHAIPIVAISTIAGMPDEVVGTVRINEVEPGVWWGSRLAVKASHRRIGTLGPSLIRLAVSTAHARGCVRFFAHVQAPNELLFRRLSWMRKGEVELHGHAHVFMQADLAAYPPIGDGRAGFLAVAEARRAA